MKRKAGWTLLSSHGLILLHIARQPDVTVRVVAENLGISRRRVNSVLSDLESGGMIRRLKVGRRNQYTLFPDVPLRHPYAADITVGSLLTALGEQPAS